MDLKVHPFWTTLIQPGETSQLQYPDNYFLIITNVCITELPSEVDNKSPVRLIANIKVVESKEEGQNVLLASLVPYTSEHSQLNYVFSPVNDVTLTVSGNAPVQVSGYLQPLFVDDEEEEEEETIEKEVESEKMNEE